MAILVIGGQSRNIGKTAVVCGLIVAMPQRRWTAIKITQCKHDAESSGACDCELGGRNVAIDEERYATTDTDSSRYLAAGAVRSLWVRTRPGHLGEAMVQICSEIDSAANVILESNSILRYLKPDLYAAVLAPERADFKPSALQYLDRADAILISAEQRLPADRPGVQADLMQRIRTFRIEPPSYCSAEFAAFVAQTLDRAFAPRR